MNDGFALGVSLETLVLLSALASRLGELALCWEECRVARNLKRSFGSIDVKTTLRFPQANGTHTQSHKATGTQVESKMEDGLLRCEGKRRTLLVFLLSDPCIIIGH